MAVASLGDGGGQKGTVALAQQTGGCKQPHLKYFNDHKREFDEVC